LAEKKLQLKRSDEPSNRVNKRHTKMSAERIRQIFPRFRFIVLSEQESSCPEGVLFEKTPGFTELSLFMELSLLRRYDPVGSGTLSQA
jgi:hypothetical protein